MARRKDSLARLTVHLSQLSHYSPSFRRQAIISLFKAVKELENIQMHIIHISESLSKTTVDEDDGVRRTAISIWSWILKETGLELATGLLLNILVPFMKLGLTHLNKDIVSDSVKLYDVVIDERPVAMKPFIADMLPPLSKFFNPKSFEEPKKGVVDLIDLYCKSVGILLEISCEDKCIIEYNWAPAQSKSLRLQPRIVPLQTSSISPEQVNLHLPAVLKAVIPVWLQTGYLLSTPSFAVNDKSEIYLFKRSLAIFKVCYRLCKHVGLDLGSFIPVKLKQSNSWAAILDHLINE